MAYGYMLGEEVLLTSDPSKGKPVEFTEQPTCPSGYVAEYSFEDVGERIVQKWTVVPEIGTLSDALVKAVRKLAEGLTDEQVAEFPALYDQWNPKSVSYKAGDRRLSGNQLYKCLMNHTSNSTCAPEVSPSLWSPIYLNESGYEEWNGATLGSNHINTGDIRFWKGKLWISLRDGNTSEPGTDEWWDEYAA